MNTWADKEISPKCSRESSGARVRGWTLRPNDLFALFNLILFALLASSVYWQRFVQFKGRANLPEFVFYATVIMAGIVVAWVTLRPFPFSISVMVAFEAGVLLHFAGGLIHWGGMRLYDHQIGISFFDYPMRFDKIVHCTNALIGCAVTVEIFRLLRIRFPRALIFFVTLVVVGVGALIEIVEYVVMKTIPHNGVGDYDNNMTDLLANLVGCLVFALLWRVKPLRRRLPSPDEEP